MFLFLGENGFVTAPTSYGEYSVAKFLIPYRIFPFFLRRAVRDVLRDVETAIEIHKPDKVSVITHSFGTYVFSRILQEEPFLRWHRIIFCGSVVRDNFPLHQFLNRFSFPLLNEVGTHDFLPALAESVTWGYGSVGSHGFNRPPVETRWHQGFRHSSFLSGEFCKNFWVPFLLNGTVKKGDPSGKGGGVLRRLFKLPLRWILVAALVVSASLISTPRVDEIFSTMTEKIWAVFDSPSARHSLTVNKVNINSSVMKQVLRALCASENGISGSATRLSVLIKIYQQSEGHALTGKLDARDIDFLINAKPCAGSAKNYYENIAFRGGIVSNELLNMINGALPEDRRLPAGATIAEFRARLQLVRHQFSSRLELTDPELGDELTRDLTKALISQGQISRP